ncbi:MAG: A/G-specific adenine glycosylase [Lentisphaeria bacterium]
MMPIPLNAATAARLLAWYHANRRPMPWREQPTPYRVWLSEIMLQQTQVVTVIPYFERFTARFPDLPALAAADEQAVLKLWEGLGYYSRARNLLKAARQLMTEHGGRFPETFDNLRTLPGIGDYTAAAIASISFGEAVPVVDGNVLRIYSRWHALADDIARPQTRAAVFAALQTWFKRLPPTTCFGDLNQAMMELGAMVCTPRSPHCEACPVAAMCAARAAGTPEAYPVKRAKSAVPHYQVAVGVVWRKEKLLIAQRRPEQMLGGLWELPGGKPQPGEMLAETVRRELREETGLAVEVGAELATVRHAYSHFRITLTAFTCQCPAGRARPLASAAIRWVRPAELAHFPFPTATRKLFPAISLTN